MPDQVNRRLNSRRAGFPLFAGLGLAKISAVTKDPPAGTIDRDAGGQPTGVLKESAQNAVLDLIPPATPQQQRDGILKSIDDLHREGMTAVKDPDIGRPVWDAYVELLRENKLSEHICVLWHAGSTLASARAALTVIQSLPRPPQSLGDGLLLSCGAKIYMDGSGGARTAWLTQEWHKNSTDIDRAIETMAALEKRYDAGYPEAQAPFAARYGLWASVERETLKGTYGAHPFGTAESVDIHAALRSYTVWGARQLFLEDRIGSLEIGKEADIAVWDRDMYTTPAQDLRNLKCTMTLVHGRVVFDSERP
jgi:predicted amidohydrolase YtcJ